jgi:PEP-CTERM motif
MKKTALILSIAALAAVGSAQNRNSFKQMNSILGVTVTRAQTAQGTTFTVSMAQGATVTRNGRTHELEAIDGFWLLSNNGDLGASQVAKNGWNNHTNTAGGASTYGFQTELNNGIRAGGSEMFTYSSISNPGALAHYGFKVKAKGTPAHIYEGSDCEPVPEPATMAALGLGVAAMVRRKRAKK